MGVHSVYGFSARRFASALLIYIEVRVISLFGIEHNLQLHCRSYYLSRDWKSLWYVQCTLEVVLRSRALIGASDGVKAQSSLWWLRAKVERLFVRSRPPTRSTALRSHGCRNRWSIGQCVQQQPGERIMRASMYSVRTALTGADA